MPHLVRTSYGHASKYIIQITICSWKKKKTLDPIVLRCLPSNRRRIIERTSIDVQFSTPEKKGINCPLFAHRSQYITPIVSFCFQIFRITRTIPTRSNDYDSTTRTRNSHARIARAYSSGNARWRGICGTSAAKSRDSSVHTATTVANGRRTYAGISRESIRIAAFTFWTLS